MSAIDPSRTTAIDLASQALRDCGAWGVGQTPLAEDIQDAKMRLQWMLQQWERKRWFVYHLVTYKVVARQDPEGLYQGKQFYTVGPGGDFNTDIRIRPWSDGAELGTQQGQFANEFGAGYPISARPSKIESCFLRQLTMSQPNQIDYPMTQIFSMEDYNRIALKGLSSFPGYFFYDSSWELGLLYPWPIPQANIYEVHISIREQLPPMFTQSAMVIDLPYEYFNALVLNLALRLRPKYGIVGMPGDTLPTMAKDSLNVLKKTNFQIARIQIPGDLVRPQLYNIFSDRMY
jgi:hypothetical protein